MSLQRRLTLFFVLIVILPLAAAGFVVQRVVVGEISRRAVLSLAPALDATVAMYNDRVEGLGDRVRLATEGRRLARVLKAEDRAEAERFLETRLLGAYNLDFLIALDTDGRPLAYEASGPAFLNDFEPPDQRELTTAEPGVGPGFVKTAPIPVEVAGKGGVGSIVGGLWLDRSLLAGTSSSDVRLSLVADGRVIASTAPLGSTTSIDIRTDEAFEADIDGESRARAETLDGDVAVVASTSTSPLNALSRRVVTSMLGLLVLALIGTSVLAYLLARLITQPLEDLSQGADAIAEGRFDYRIKARSKDELGQLATAFNDMAARLEGTITELSSSRDQLQRAVRRVGETLRSTHDMTRMLESTLHTAVDAVQADAGALWRFTPTRTDLYAGAMSGFDPDSLGRVHVGEGIIGLVAERATNVLLPTEDGGPRTAAGEPAAPVMIAIPLYSQDRVMGVLAVYRNDPERPFSQEDLDTVVFLAEQGGVAIENVQLHEEARRLSLMDGLTGIWNRRFFQMQFRQVLATATRFERPFSVLMLDLDFFKKVNDTYGHQRGDAILIEFAHRVNGTLREIDTFARYGGEEFICLLSETDVEGARTTAEKICEVIRSEPFGAIGEEAIALTVSIGVASHPEHGQSYRALVEAADKALYEAKENGRNRVVVARKGPASQLKLAT
jgi:two-component system, cell cycle response regulator